MSKITRSLIAEVTKVLAGRTKPSLLKEDLKQELDKFGGATGAWIKLTPEYFKYYGIEGKAKETLAAAEEIYLYDDEEGGLDNPQVVVAKSNNRYYVVTDKTIYSFSDKSGAVQKAAKEAALERL